MAQRFNRAMEIMGWRVPEEDNEVFGDEFEVVEEAEVREVDFRSMSGIQETAIEVAPRHNTSIRRIVTVHPTTYDDARIIGEAFRDGIPVIMNLTNLADAEARRIVDFAAGLVFGLHGIIEKVTPRVFLLSPDGVEVATKAERRSTNLFG